MTFSNKDHDEDKNTDEVLTQKSGPLSSCRSNLRSARSSKGFVSGSYTDRDEIPVEKSMDSYNLEEIDPSQLPNLQGNEIVRTAFTRAGKMSIVFDDGKNRIREPGA